MAILNKIRQKTIVLILVIAMALFAFILSGLFDGSASFSDKSQSVVGSINGKDISREDFMFKVENAQRQMGPNATTTQVMNRVWEQEVRQAVMETQFDELGISVEKDQIRDLLKNAYASTPQFLNEAGLFDENKLNEYIANLKNTSKEAYANWVANEKQIAANALQENYFNLVKAGLTGTLAEGALEHKLEGNKVDIKYVQVAYSSIPDSTVTVSKSEISDYIKTHKKEFEVEASRDIRFVQFNEVASVEDENAIHEELVEYVNGRQVDKDGRTDPITAFFKVENNEEYINIIANSDIKFDERFVFKSSLPTKVADSIYNLEVAETFGPYKDAGSFKVTKLIAVKQISDSVKVRHILIPFVGGTRAGSEVTKTDGEAKATADSIYNIIKSRRAKFTDLLELSSDKVSNKKNGEIEFAYTDSFAPEFKDFSFDNKKGDIDVVKTSFGYHIIEILSQNDKQRAIQIGTIARKIEPSEGTSSKIFREASNFEINAADAGFEELSKESKFSVRPVNGMKALDENIIGLGSQRPIVRWAFEKDVNVGDIKRFNVSNGYVVAQLVAKHKKGLMSVDEATAKVLPIIRKEKKAALIRNRVTVNAIEDLAAAENTNVRSAPAINMKNPTISGAGREPLVVGYAFGLKEGETSKLIEGEKGVYMVKVTKVTPAVELDNYQAAANRVEQKKSSTVASKLYSALKEAAEIEDNRVESQIQ